MANTGKITIAIFILCFILMIPLSLMVQYDNVVQQQNTEVKAALTTASFDAVQTASLHNGTAFSTLRQQTDALDAFYMSLSASYYSVLSSNNTLLNAYLPFVMLVDNDGVYVCYALNADSYWSDAALRDKPDFTNDEYYITPLSAYAESYTLGGSSELYTVFFNLSDKLTIYQNNKLIAEGSYIHVKQVLDKKYPNAINNMPFMHDETMCIDERQAVVTNTVGRLINKYLNEDVRGNDYVGFNIDNYNYTFILPSESTYRQNAISGPTVLAFYHGPQIHLNAHSIAQVAFAGGELSKEEYYYITTDSHGNKYYHTKGCSHVTGHSVVVSSMEEAAKAGAYPDPDCIY